MKVKKKKNKKDEFTPFPKDLYQKGHGVDNCISLPLAICLGTDNFFKDTK